MSKMIERVAKVIAISHGVDDWDSIPNISQSVFTAHARAVMDAMREPSEFMLQCGAYGSGEGSESVALDSWESMIDAALQE